MQSALRVLGLVPARAGSKGIPGKNLRSLAGKPLLAYTAEAARAARSLARVVLSTEDERIAELGRRLGLDVPFRRPAELARDDAPMLPVVRHALETLEGRGERYDAVCLLQPTSPLRRAADVDRCVARLAEGDVDAVVSVLPVPHEHNPHWVFVERDGLLHLATGEGEPIPRRQELPPAYHRDGSVYVTRREAILAGSLFGRRLAGVAMDPSRHVNLDQEDDWQRAERLLAGGGAAGADR